ncbi:MAG: hypothetical protein A3B79_05165 [Deltaproteobacteria bacterium RIFCSPHIGHO2_02_FULL_50_15]|nr:MAG: hypothetical protein A3B79_05165 [Deltaproteobacteria bacterium RIFCSPHIGHO2_02_FULL_50_15]
MRILALLIIPVLLGILSLLSRAETRRKFRRFVLSITAFLHLMLTASFHFFPVAQEKQGFFSLDPLGLLFLSVTSLLFLLVSLYAWGYFHHERKVVKEGVSHLFTPCMLFFLTAMTLTSVTHHLGVLWVAIEGTTLASALGILRFYQVCLAANLGHFMSRLFILFGLLSLFIAAAFIIKQRDYKRMLAYSSVEHMGILALGIGVGSGFGGLLHVVNHSLAKALLFLTAGQILIAYRTKMTSEVHGLLRKLPLTGVLLGLGIPCYFGIASPGPLYQRIFNLQRWVILGSCHLHGSLSPGPGGCFCRHVTHCPWDDSGGRS